MAIQFPCGACGQPVEIDDEWAGKTVACPFCHSQIIAPTESRLTNSDDVPMATAMQPPSPIHPPTSAAPPASTEVLLSASTPSDSNRLAIVAVVLAALMLILFIIFNRIMSVHVTEVQAVAGQVQQAVEQGKGVLVAVQKAQLEFLEHNGGVMPTWLAVAVMCEILGGLTWISALICAVIAVRRPAHKRYSIAALVACGVTPILFCCVGGSL